VRSEPAFTSDKRTQSLDFHACVVHLLRHLAAPSQGDTARIMRL
jgi:hypothetical protein